MSENLKEKQKLDLRVVEGKIAAWDSRVKLAKSMGGLVVSSELDALRRKAHFLRAAIDQAKPTQGRLDL